MVPMCSITSYSRYNGIYISVNFGARAGICVSKTGGGELRIVEACDTAGIVGIPAIGAGFEAICNLFPLSSFSDRGWFTRWFLGVPVSHCAVPVGSIARLRHVRCSISYTTTIPAPPLGRNQREESVHVRYGTLAGGAE